MLTRTLRCAGGVFAAAALMCTLTACASSAGYSPTSPLPTMAPEQSVSDACGIASAEIDDLVAEIRQHVEAAGASLVSGEMPDLSGIVPSATAIIDRVAEGVTNPEVSAALDDVRSAIEGFGEVPAPESITGVPEYLTGLGAQLAELQSAAADLQHLCDRR